MQALLKSQGWARLSSIAEAQVKTRTAGVLAPRKLGNEFEQEFQKGEISGIRLFMQLPSISVEDFDRQLTEMGDPDATVPPA